MRVGEFGRSLKLFKQFVEAVNAGRNSEKPAAEAWRKAVATHFERPQDHGYSGGCPMVKQVLEEPYAVRMEVTILALLPLRFMEAGGQASVPCKALPHFVELLATRAVKSNGFATGGVMRSKPGDTLSHDSHGHTMLGKMKSEASADGLMVKKVSEM